MITLKTRIANLLNTALMSLNTLLQGGGVYDKELAGAVGNLQKLVATDYPELRAEIEQLLKGMELTTQAIEKILDKTKKQ